MPLAAAVYTWWRDRRSAGGRRDRRKPQIDLALRQALSPWAFNRTTTLGFGGRVLRSALLDFVEDLPDVDFVTDFRLSLEGSRDDMAEIVPDAPDVILVSAARHRIEEL